MTRYHSPMPDYCQICGRTFDPEFYNEIDEPYQQYCQYCHRILHDYENNPKDSSDSDDIDI